MVEIDLYSCNLSDDNQYIKLLCRQFPVKDLVQSELMEVRGGQTSVAPPPERRPLISPGLYIVPNGCAYGALYAEIGDTLLREPDLIPEYVLAQIDSGAININSVRNSRNRNIRISEPCIFLNSTAHWVYGHWLLDILPRAWIAKQTLGDAFANYLLLVPSDSPAHMLEAMCRVLGINQSRLYFFDDAGEILSRNPICIPSLPHNSYCPNPVFAGFVDALKANYDTGSTINNRKIYISRSRYRGISRSVRRSISDEALIEQAFETSGYEIVYPESLTFGEQIDLFSQCSVLAGESGSALHNSVFSGPGTVVISLSSINDVQPKLADFFGHHLITLIPDEIEKCNGNELQRYDMNSIAVAIQAADRLARSPA